MINLIDCINDKNNHAALGSGMVSGLIGMILWIFPLLNAWTATAGVFGTVIMIAITVFTTSVVTGFYKRHETKIQDFIDMKIAYINKKIKRNGKEKDNAKRA